MKVAKRPKLRFHWYGRPPKVGEYLRSESPRARTAYLIVATNWKWNANRQRWVGPVTVERLSVALLPEEDAPRVHAFRWTERKRKHRGRAPIL